MNNVTVLQSPDSITIKQDVRPIYIIQQIQEITVSSQNLPSQFQPFSFTSTVDGQTSFGPLSQVPIAIITLAIAGALQNADAGTPDYTLDNTGLNIILSDGIPSGYTVYGMMQTS